MNDTQKRIEKAQKEYDSLRTQLAALAKSDKKVEADLRDEMKKKLDTHGGSKETLLKKKGKANAELTAAKAQRVVEIAAGVKSGDISPVDAKAELVSLGHTEASADIDIARAKGEPLSTTAPSPTPQGIFAPDPTKEVPKPVEQSAPIKGDDPFSANQPQSRDVVYRDTSDQEKNVAAKNQPKK